MSGPQKLLIRIDENQVCQIRGYKLLEKTSERSSEGVRDRWFNLELYYSVEQLLVLIIRYDSETSNTEEREVPYAHVEKLRSWRELAQYLDTYDFMRHVRLDDYCGGHVSLMLGHGLQAAKLRLHFRRTALDFLAECMRMQSDWNSRLKIELW